MNKFVKKITKGIILSMILMFVLNMTAIQLDNKTDNVNQTAISDHSFIPGAYAQDDDEVDMEFTEEEAALTEEEFAEYESQQAIAAAKASKDTGPSPAQQWERLKEKIVAGSMYMHRLFSPLVNFFSFKIGNFIGNDHIFNGAMGAMLKKIWVVSRNLVNILFVLILLFIALKEIFWIKDEGGTDLKKSLLTFVLLLVAVNFSWLVTKVVLDAANVATNVVFAIPMGIDSAGGEVELKTCEVLTCGQTYTDEDGNSYQPNCLDKQKKKLIGNCSPSQVYVALGDGGSEPNIENLHKDECDTENIKEKYSGDIVLSAFDENGDVNTLYEPGEGEADYRNTTTFCWETLDLAKYDQNTSVIYLTYGMARIQNVVNMSGTDSFVNLSIGIIFSLILQVAYTVALMALFIALIIRMAVLWLFVAFSPFMVLLLFSDVIGPLAEGAKGKVDFSAFLKWAFVPVKVGAVFTVAFLMISAGQTLGSTDVSVIDTFSGGGVDASYKIYNAGALFAGIGGINQFIWYLITVAVLWMGVFAVLGEMPIIRNITDKIKGYGVDTAKLVATTPYWAPIMPMIDPGTGKFKIGSYEKEFKGYGLKGMLETAKEKALDKKPAEKAGEINKIEQEKINKMSANEAFKAVKGHVGTAQEIEKHGGIDKVIGEMKHLDKNGKDAIKQGYKNALGIGKAVKEKTGETAAATTTTAGEVAKGTQAGILGAEQQNLNQGKGASGDNPASGTTAASPQPGGGTKPQGDDQH